MMDSSYASSVLRISLDESAERLEVVASMTVNDTNTSRVEAVRPDKTPIFPDPSRGRKYMMEFTANRSLVDMTGSDDHADTQREISRMQLVWNGKSNYRKVTGDYPRTLLQTLILSALITFVHLDVYIRVRGTLQQWFLPFTYKLHAMPLGLVVRLV